MSESKNSIKILKLLAEKYPSKESIYERIIHLKSQLALPKDTEHFMSDIHGEYDGFFHIINNCSGIILEKVDIQWDSHDMLWIGTALGSEVCIAGVIRNTVTLNDGKMYNLNTNQFPTIDKDSKNIYKLTTDENKIISDIY